MDRLDQLRAAMVLSIHGGVNRALIQWVGQHHGPPQSLDSVKLRAIVLDFDTFLMQPGTEDSDFTRGIIRLRNVFARHAKMAAPATVTLSPRPSPWPAPLPGPPRPQPLVTDEGVPRSYTFDANSVLAEALSRVLDSPSWIDAIHLPAFGAALPQPEV
ncbi:MAG: hypothetical protein Q8L48_27975 [Archangium sp.]|nr:hypothetical protein [Archangium sp.]